MGVLATTLLAGALLLQNPAEMVPSGAEAPPPSPDPSGLAIGSPQWFATDEPPVKWGFRNFLPRVGVAHRSQGYGYDRGYTSIEGFVPVLQHDFDSLTALQGNYLIDNGGEYGFNAGIIQRKYVEGMDRVFGVNGFYDHRREDGSSFNQMGFGVETLGTYIDWRLNGYFPFGDDIFVVDGGGVTSAEFSGRQILVNFLANKALAGFDTEIGGVLPRLGEAVRGYIGVYQFSGESSDDVFGVQGRLEARLQDSLVLHLGVTNDGTFDTNVVFGIGWYFPSFTPRNTPPFGRAAARLGEPVYRNQNITIERGELEEPVPARWNDGSIIDVVHVNSVGILPGDGTIEDPFHLLTAAQNAAGEGSIIFAHANSTFNGLDASVDLQARQQLLGEGLDHPIDSLYGPFLLPTVTPPEDVQMVPLLNGAPAVGVTVNDDTVVRGFQIHDPGLFGVTGSNVTNVVLDGVDIRSTGAGGFGTGGILLTNVSGDIAITNSFVVNRGGHAIVLSTANEGDNEITITDNTATNNAGIGIDVAINGDTDNILHLERNRVFTRLDAPQDRNLPLVQLETRDSSRLRARIEENLFDDTFNDPDNLVEVDPFYDQFSINVMHSSQADLGILNNRFETNRTFLAPASGPFSVDITSSDLAKLRLRLEGNEGHINYAFRELFISEFQVEDTLDTNNGTIFYFPFDVFIDVLPEGTIDLP